MSVSGMFACLVVLGCLMMGETKADSCSYKVTCRKLSRTKSCGFWGWSRCNVYTSGYCSTSVSCTQTWDDWGSCSKTCLGGRRIRRGTCTARNKCSKSISQTATCNTHRCPVPGGWTKWSSYSCDACSATCGDNVVKSCKRTRTCTNPRPQYNGADCQGLNSEIMTETCRVPTCPVHGSWTDWSNWNCEACESKSCQKSRSCTNPAPLYGGRNCPGISTEAEYQHCTQPVCHAKGGWTDYSSDWICSTCSKKCGGGTQTCSVTRTCEEQPCVGSNTISKLDTCNTEPCPVDGKWSTWYDSRCGDCDTDCGIGKRTCTQFRQCTNPARAHGGAACVGDSTKTKTISCTGTICPVNGGWSAMSDKVCGECSTSCGPGTRTCQQFRQCNNPAPQNKGLDCQGPNTSISTETCTIGSCSVVGTWSDYTSDWACGSTCSKTCDGGTVTCSVTRTCVVLPCQGSDTISKSKLCNTQPCPVDGGWSEFEEEEMCSECSTTCGRGSKTCRRSRKCSNPVPDDGGLDCEGPDFNDTRKSCNRGDCTVTEPSCRVECDSVASGYIAYFPDDKYCNKYHTCENGVKYQHTCDHGRFWDDTAKKCDWFKNVNCEQCEDEYKSCVQSDGGIHCAPAKEDCPSGTTDPSTLEDEDEDDAVPCTTPLAKIPDNTTDCRGYFYCVYEHWIRMPCANGTGFSMYKQQCIKEECNEQEATVVCVEGKTWPSNSESCNEYIVCAGQSLVLMTCPAGTRYHADNETCVELEHVPCLTDHLEDTECRSRTNGERFKHPTCSLYYQCVHGKLLVRQCAPTEPFYDPILDVCTWPIDSPCGII